MTEPRNYQPIAVLSQFSKVLERLVHDQLYSFLEIKEILHKYKFDSKLDKSHKRSLTN